MTFLSPIPRLYVYVQEGCPSCAEAEPHVARLVREHSLHVLVTVLHLDRKDWRILNWQPKYTPGYALVDEGKIVNKHEGAMAYEELLSWIWPPEVADEDPEEDPEEEEAQA